MLVLKLIRILLGNLRVDDQQEGFASKSHCDASISWCIATPVHFEVGGCPPNVRIPNTVPKLRIVLRRKLLLLKPQTMFSIVMPRHHYGFADHGANDPFVPKSAAQNAQLTHVDTPNLLVLAPGAIDTNLFADEAEFHSVSLTSRCAFWDLLLLECWLCFFSGVFCH